MRRKLLREGSDQLTYEIRGIVKVAKRLQDMGMEITWENIGDPIQKGEQIPAWIKKIIKQLVSQNGIYAYVDTRGIPATREFLAKKVNEREGCQIAADDILFFNGLGDAVSKIFALLKRGSRVLGPSPAYSTHSSAEAAHSGGKHLTYQLQAEKDWMPDIKDIENKVRYNDSIAGLLLINPDNPTGAVYATELLEQIVDIASRYDLFLICDEIYTDLVYNGVETSQLSEVIGDVPGIALRGISKTYPWPGSRCGWIEIFNKEKHPEFREYIEGLVNAKMLEVCSTSLPQASIPQIMGDRRYPAHLQRRRNTFEKRAEEAWKVFSKVEGVSVVKPKGAFYMTVLFDEGVLNNDQQLEIRDKQLREFIQPQLGNVEADKRFVYNLLASTGICVVPLSGFCCERHGFRVTLLENDDDKRQTTWETIASAISTYLGSV